MVDQNEWQLISTAPKNATWIRGKTYDGEEYTVHWAENLSGEEQPPFRGWFAAYSGGFYEIDSLQQWRPCTADERAAVSKLRLPLYPNDDTARLDWIIKYSTGGIVLSTDDDDVLIECGNVRGDVDGLMACEPKDVGTKYAVLPKHVEWEMDWSDTNPDGTRKYPHKPEKEMVFEPEKGLALLLINEKLLINSLHPRKGLYLGVLCNDVFAWGCSDVEDACYDDLEDIYTMWRKDPSWGTAIWCMIQRKQLPQGPVLKSILKNEIWDIDALTQEHGLRKNHYDGVSLVIAQHKYNTYAAWAEQQGLDVRPFDKHWWAGWTEYTTAHPKWHDAQWIAEDNRLRTQFRIENGYEDLLAIDVKL